MNRDFVTSVFLEVSQYRHADGAYSAWNFIPASTWLTAFVAKVFCQANSVVDNAVNVEHDLKITLKWLADHVQADGSFVDNMPVVHREMKGQMNERDPSLTSFVLVSLLECAVRSPEVVKTIERAVKYVEHLDRGMLRSNPYILALSAYALAMTESVTKWEFKSLLESQALSDGTNMYWGNARGQPASADAVETTSYALLAMLKLNDFNTSAQIVRWITSQRDANGSLQGIVVGLQALSSYRQRTLSFDVNLQISLVDSNNSRELDIYNDSVQRIVGNLPIERDKNRLTVRVKGSGSARMMIDLRYNRPAADDEICPFHITEVEVYDAKELPKDNKMVHDLNCDVCGNCDSIDQDQSAFDTEPNTESRISKTCVRFSVKSKTKQARGMTIVNFGLETDVEVLQEDLKKLMQDNPNIIRYELPSSGSGFILFYLDQITPVETNFIFRLKDNNKGNIERKLSSYVKVYNYSNPDQHCTKIYGTERKRYEGFSYECGDDSRQICRCVRNTCAKNVVNELERQVFDYENPVNRLFMFTCNPERADYAVFVTIKEVNYDHVREQRTATGIVTRKIHGFHNDSGSYEMKFFWYMYCDEVELRIGSQYLIIGKVGDAFNLGPNDKEIRYPLTDTTLVIEHNNDRQLIDRIMMAYERVMKKRPCAF